jgi:ribosomal protein S18 acetylase RimI-like enzyme
MQTKTADPHTRRFKLLRRMGLGGTDTKGAVVKRATTLEEFLGAYRLVHDTFVEKGYMSPQPGRLRVRCCEAFPETATFVAVSGPDVVGVQSLVRDADDAPLPSDRAFGDVLEGLRGEGRLLCEATNEAVAEPYRRSAVPSELMRCLFAHAVSIGCTHLVTAVSPGHANFYRLLGFEQLGETRDYAEAAHDPVVLMVWSLEGLEQRLAEAEAAGREDARFLRRFCFEDNAYWRDVAVWAILAERTFAEPMCLRELFVSRSRLLARCDQRQCQAIARRWGRQLLDEVLSGLPTAAVGG